MKWVPYPCSIADDPRMIAAGEAAEILWTRAWGWTGQHETDGVISADAMGRLCPARTRFRLTALLEHELLVECEDGYLLTDWAAVTADVRGLDAVREKAAARAKRYRDRKKNAVPSPPPPPVDIPTPSRDANVTHHGQEEEENNYPPNPPASRGACNPSSPIHLTGCRACGTNIRAGRTNAADEHASLTQAVTAHNDARSALGWCGDCERPEYRWHLTERGYTKCAACHPDLVIGPRAEPPAAPTRHLTVVARRGAS